GLTLLPLAMVFAVEFSAPLWSVLLAALVLREYPNRPQQLGVVLGLVGILISLRPGLAGFSWAIMSVLLAAFAYAATYLCTRMLGRTDGVL
ncbi:EamA family transporter, partial [Acinetobacter baumannii]